MNKSILLLSFLLTIGPARAGVVGSIFLTGHDPDFHAFAGGNQAGAAAITKDAIQFVTNPTYNTFAASGIHKFLYVTSSITPPSGHVDGTNGIIASGYIPGTDFDRVDASNLAGALAQLGTKYDALVVASDYGGILTQAELNILDSQSANVISFLNSGGGLYAMAESDSGAGLTPDGGLFGYLPFILTSAQKNQSEVGITITPYGAGLGLTDVDVNGNASHNVFLGTSGLNIVDLDSSGAILSLAGRGQVTPGGIAPEPSSLFLVLYAGIGALVLGMRRGPHQFPNVDPTLIQKVQKDVSDCTRLVAAPGDDYV